MSVDPLRPDDAPPSIYGPDGNPRFFQDPALDRLVAVLLNVASELWVQTERVDTLTRLLDDAGVTSDAARAAIEVVEDEKRDRAIRDFMTRVLGPLRESVK